MPPHTFPSMSRLGGDKRHVTHHCSFSAAPGGKGSVSGPVWPPGLVPARLGGCDAHSRMRAASPPSIGRSRSSETSGLLCEGVMARNPIAGDHPHIKHVRTSPIPLPEVIRAREWAKVRGPDAGQ